MSRKKAGGIFASSFVAGLLLAAALVSPRAWEPIPGPYFGLDEPAATASDTAAMEAAHAELSARKMAQAQPQGPAAAAVPGADVPRPASPAQPDPVAVPAPADPPLVAAGRAAAVAREPDAATVAAPGSPMPGGSPQPREDRQAVRDVAPTGPAAVAVAPPPVAPPPVAVGPVVSPPVVAPAPTVSASVPASAPLPNAVPERLALAATDGPQARSALAAAVPPPHAAGMPPAQPAAAPPAVAAESGSDPTTVQGGPWAEPAGSHEGSFQGMVQRVRPVPPARPGSSSPPPAPPMEAAAPQPRPVATPAVIPPPPPTWSDSLARAPAVGAPASPPATNRTAPARDPLLAPAHQSMPPGGSAGSGRAVGAAPLPGEPWNDPDGVNWSDALAAIPILEPERKRTWLGDWRNDPRSSPPRVADQRGGPHIPGGRILDRIRGSDRRLAQLPNEAAEAAPPLDSSPPDIGTWPRPTRLDQQLDHLHSLAAGAGAGGEPIRHWTTRTRAALEGVHDTRGPRDPAADASLIQLGETVLAGMSLADSTADQPLATHARRAALAAARRVAVWRAAAALFAALDRNPRELSPNDAGAAMAKQAAGRTVVEIARLLHGIERFELASTAAEATAVKGSLGTICGFYPTAARGVAKAVEDHYLSPNVRVAVHQQFLERLLPGATVDTARFQDVVMGREVRGTRTVERKTVLRLVPDDDEIAFNLEVHGDIASRSVTDAGPVSVTARSASEFSVQKPFKVGPYGLAFGNATGVASNRSHVDNIQTSFDGMPVMGSLVRNMARNQQADAMPEANREVIDKIVSRACREVDSQAEPEFARMADRIRDRVWMPLVRLGLEPKAVAMQTTATVATMRLRLAGESQLAAHTPRPRSPAEAMLSLQLHESSANNAFEKLGIAGRRLTLGELIQLVCSQVGVEPRIPDDLPDDVTVAFAKEQPLRVECRDGLVHVQVVLDAIESGRRDWYDITAHVAYKPACSGRQVFLEREGPVRLSGKGHEGRMELALRTIFGKVFPKERAIAVLPEQIVGNPRLADVEAVQAVSSDGWLALTLEQRQAAATATTAPKKPAPQRQGDMRRKIMFR